MAASRSTLKVLTALILVALAGWATWARLRVVEDEAEDEVDAPSAAEGAVVESVQEQFRTELPVPVAGAVAILDTLRISVGAEGRAEAIRLAKVKARKSGLLSDLRVRENQLVEAGDTLARIDTTEYALDLAARGAALRRAQADYRARILGDEAIADPEAREARDKLARAVTGLEQAEVDYRRAVLNLEQTAVRAPFAGRVADIMVVAGQFLGEGEEVATVVDADPIEVAVQVLGTEVVHLEEGNAATVEFTAFPGSPFIGRIETINPLVDPATSTARVTVHIANTDGSVLPGMYAEAQLEARKFAGRLLVPRTALLEASDGRPYLFVLEEDRAAWRYVHPGMQNDELVELLDPGNAREWVEAGETVLVDGHHYLTHDALVKVTDDPVGEGGRPSR
ncbi:MAG: efflux RND transporter periplasmic adaptor subunit [Gemmatimonadetes bacterium]|nr:efflux RND transporter periplasmic adaptor subunit [Gemmatimonadota bacterium]MCY3944575.1 efflux RND transporter periplasmic adaptor subunit [Gemmatimonadota bacterium]